MVIDTQRVIADFAWVMKLITLHAELAAMPHHVTESHGGVQVEVHGAHYEARAWRAAINGRICPSHIDRYGVRRQLVVGSRVQVQVVQYPA